LRSCKQRKWLELRAAMGLAQLLGERGRHSEAHDLLESVYGWFTEGLRYNGSEGSEDLA
jgi:hypothetical protein